MGMVTARPSEWFHLSWLPVCWLEQILEAAPGVGSRSPRRAGHFTISVVSEGRVRPLSRYSAAMPRHCSILLALLLSYPAARNNPQSPESRRPTNRRAVGKERSCSLRISSMPNESIRQKQALHANGRRHPSPRTRVHTWRSLIGEHHADRRLTLLRLPINPHHVPA
jgi:hypothetical protein